MKLCPTCRTKYPDDANFCPQESCATADGPQRLQPAPEAAKVRFHPLTRIGGSTTGEVWKARDGETGAEVAYKVIALEVLPTATAQSRAEREFKQLARVQSPKVATVLDSGRTPDGRLYVAMELVEGEPLERVLRTGPLSFERAKSIVGQIGQALLEAQKAGIVHRDVSPKNVLVSAAGDVKVINFPVARPLSDKVSGVPAYVSPEQAQGKPVDQRSNTYSLACILYQLLTGEPPFQAATPQGVLDLHVGSPPLPPSQRRPEANLSPDIDRVILKALDKNSSRRHLTLRLFLTEIEALSAPGAAMPAAGAGASGQGSGVAFAKTMLFAGGQAEVANLVAKAIAARTGGTPPTGSPVVAAPAPRTAEMGVSPAMAARAAMQTAIAIPTAEVIASTAPSPMPEPAAPAQVAPRLESAPVAVPAPAAAVAPAPAAAAPAPAPAAAAAAASTPAGQAAPAKSPIAGKGAAFRETLWFKKGDVDQLVADAKAKLATDKAPEGEVVVPPVVDDVRPLEDRYVDDGTVTTEDRKKFSLRTGGTATALPAAGKALPGEKMTDKDVISEIAGTKRTIILVGGAVVAAVLLIVLLLMMGGSKKGAKPAPHGQAPATTLPATAAGPPAAPPVVRPAAPPAGGGEQRAAAREPAKKKETRSSPHCPTAELTAPADRDQA